MQYGAHPQGECQNQGSVVQLTLEEGIERTFQLKSCYNSLPDENQALFLAKEIWGACALWRIYLFIYCLGGCVRKIQIIDVLMRRGWSIINRCSLGKVSEKSTNYILIHWDRTQRMQDILLAIFRLQWVFFSRFCESALSELKVDGMDKRQRRV